MRIIYSFVEMIEEDKQNIAPPSSNKKVFLVDKYICNYITSEWLTGVDSDREHAKNLGIHHNLIKKIKQKDGYKMPIATLTTMCFFKEIKLSDFFKKLEGKYGVKISDDVLRDNKKDA